MARLVDQDLDVQVDAGGDTRWSSVHVESTTSTWVSWCFSSTLVCTSTLLLVIEFYLFIVPPLHPRIASPIGCCLHEVLLSLLFPGLSTTWAASFGAPAASGLGEQQR